MTGFEDGARKLIRIERHTILLVLVFAVVAGLVTKSFPAAWGFLLGGALMLANFHFLWRFARKAMEEEEVRRGAFLGGLFALFLVFLGAVAVALLVLDAPVIPFFLGTLSLLASIFLNSLIFI